MGLIEFSNPTSLRQSIPVEQLERFDCGVLALNNWLKTRALQNERYGSSRTYVSFASDGNIAGFCCLSNAVITREWLPAAKRRNQPNPVPCCLLGRLAVDKRYQGRKLGAALLLRTVKLSCSLSEISGCWALLVQPKTNNEISFYEHFGFRQSKLITSPPMLFYELHRPL